MKKSGLFLTLTSLLFISSSLAMAYHNIDLMENFKNLLERDLQHSFGEISSLKCSDPNAALPMSLFCEAGIKFVDVVSPDELQGGGEENCTEVYVSYGLNKYSTICSTCSHSENTKHYASSCSLNSYEDQKSYVAYELLRLLNESVDFEYITKFERPVFAASYKTDTGYIEFYQLTYTRPLLGNGGGQHGNEEAVEVIGQESLCEFIMYDPNQTDFFFTSVSCKEPMTDKLLKEMAKGL